ncbi:MAG: hypothetical protein HKN13_04605 [Rhodothermales bacterium]|nr:hypothetical protein [Rhodothermales bacterium]
MRLVSLSLCIALLAMAGCAEQPFAPSAVGEAGDESAAAKKGATKTVDVLEFDADGWEFYLECMDETVTYFGRLDFELTTIVTPSGNSKTTWKGLYSYPYGFTSSGDHSWLMVHGTQVSQELAKPDGRYRSQFSLHEWYENELGDRMLQIANYGARTDAQGEPVFEKFHGWCPGQPDEEYSAF